MELKGSYQFDKTIDETWQLLMDTRALAACLPGCDTFEAIGEDRYRIVLAARIAAVSGSFEGTVQIVDKQPPSSYRLIVDARGRPGFARGECDVTLVQDGAEVRVDVAGTAQIGGLVAQIGQRLVGATAKMMMDRFFACLRQRAG